MPLGGAPTLATNWKLSATADFNHDGRPDIVWRNFTSQKIVIWTMNGTAKLGNIIPTPDQAVDANWEIVGAVDLNGDGNTDFLWYNYTSGKIVYWFMDASVVRITGSFTNPANAGDANWKVLATGDYGVGAGGVRRHARHRLAQRHLGQLRGLVHGPGRQPHLRDLHDTHGARPEPDRLDHRRAALSPARRSRQGSWRSRAPAFSATPLVRIPPPAVRGELLRAALAARPGPTVDPLP